MQLSILRLPITRISRLYPLLIISFSLFHPYSLRILHLRKSNYDHFSIIWNKRMYSDVKNREVINFAHYTYVWIISNNFALSRYEIQHGDRVNIYVLRRIRHRGFVRSVCRAMCTWVHPIVEEQCIQETMYSDVPMCIYIDTLWGSSWRHESQRGIWNLFSYSRSFESSCRRWRNLHVSNFYLRYRFLSIMMPICPRQSFRYDEV